MYTYLSAPILDAPSNKSINLQSLQIVYPATEMKKDFFDYQTYGVYDHIWIREGLKNGQNPIWKNQLPKPGKNKIFIVLKWTFSATHLLNLENSRFFVNPNGIL